MTLISSTSTSLISKEDEKDSESKLSPLNLVLICALVPSLVAALIGLTFLSLIHKKKRQKFPLVKVLNLTSFVLIKD